VPILLAALPETRSAHDVAKAYQRLQARIDLISAQTGSYRNAVKGLEAEETAAYTKLRADKDIRPDNRLFAERNLREKYAAQRAALDKQYLDSARLAKDVPKMEAKQKQLSDRYDTESRLREVQLEKFTARYQGVRVVHPSVITDGKSLGAALSAAIREADVAQPQDQRTRNAEQAMEILFKMTQGAIKGYDTRPATDVILAALRAGKLSEDGQTFALDTAARLPGAKAQAEILNTIVDGNRKPQVRLNACDALVQSLQRFGLQLTRLQVKSLTDLAKDANTDAKLKSKLNTVIGALRPSDKDTGETLRKYNPKPVAPLPPPPEEKKDDKKDKDAEKKDKKDQDKDKKD
jgi:hypothetical protein